MVTSVKLAAVAGGALLLIHFLAIDASSLKNKLKVTSIYWKKCSLITIYKTYMALDRI